VTPDEARELVIDGINYAAYRETDSALHDSDKNRLFPTTTRGIGPSLSQVLGPRVISKKRWQRCSFGLMR